MASTPALECQVTITSKSILGDSVASVFNKVLQLEFNYNKGVIRLVDQQQGEFFFGLSLVTTITPVVVNNLTTYVIS